ncbi:MAG: hypothetical protein HZB51_06085 [Chloroflexi bacterium]|nr:hypothetical protein [Chloroflexota bacterium]
MIVAIVVFFTGLAIAGGTILSAVRNFVVPRSQQDRLSRVVFGVTRLLFRALTQVAAANLYRRRDNILAFYAPISLLMLLPVWYSLVVLGYTCMFWAVGVSDWLDALRQSGSSLLTLGFAPVDGLAQTILAFTEATLGLMLVALLIAYLPSMYNAFQRRELAVTMLEVRAGSPPWAINMLERYHRIHGFDRLGEVWESWEQWFAEIEESHTSLPALNFFRSPVSDRSWVTAAGAVLDAAALTRSTLDLPADPRADLCVRAGYLALRRIADFFGFPYNPNPHFPDAPISISRAEYDAVWDRLASEGIPLKADREQAWCDFAGWRVNYDTVLLALAELTQAPIAPWSSDRAPIQFRNYFNTHRR